MDVIDLSDILQFTYEEINIFYKEMPTNHYILRIDLVGTESLNWINRKSIFKRRTLLINIQHYSQLRHLV